MDTQIKLTYTFLALLGGWLLVRFFRRGLAATALRGPPSTSFLLGATAELMKAKSSAHVQESWAQMYGPVFSLPSSFGRSKVILLDPRAVAHVFAQDTYEYQKLPVSHAFIERALGRNVLSMERDEHRRQRRALAPAFNNAAIRRASQTFFDAAHKVKDMWLAKLAQAGDGSITLNVPDMLDHISLDCIGLAAFGHDFGAITNGAAAPVAAAFEAFRTVPNSWFLHALRAVATEFPVVLRVPNKRTTTFDRLRAVTTEVASTLLDRARQDLTEDLGDEGLEKSLLGLLVKSSEPDAAVKLTKDEMIGHMNILLLAGYETTTTSMAWALIRLCQQPEKQRRLRDELRSECDGADPTWDQLATGLPYLSACVHETLRLHASIPQTERVAMKDDVLPLTAPMTDAYGRIVNEVVIAKGTKIIIPNAAMNLTKTYWGADARQFVPERWLDEERMSCVKDLPGYQHLLTFGDGPRNCLGKLFAVTEFKAVLATLMQHFEFELAEGPDIEFTLHPGVVSRPKPVGAKEPTVMFRVKRAE